MGDEPQDTDKALLERLNALKLSSVQLERRKCVTTSYYVQPKKPGIILIAACRQPLGWSEPSPELDLTSRFAGLGTSTFDSNPVNRAKTLEPGPSEYLGENVDDLLAGLEPSIS